MEVTRRARLLQADPIPRTKHWLIEDRCVDWLNKHPIVNEADVAYLRREAQTLKQMVERTEQEQAVLGDSGRNWTGNVPYLRLVEDEELRRDFLRRADMQNINSMLATQASVLSPSMRS